MLSNTHPLTTVRGSVGRLVFDDDRAGEYVVRRAAFGVEERVENAQAERGEREHVDERAPRALRGRRYAGLARVYGVQAAERHPRRAPGERERAGVIEEHRRRRYPRHRAPHARVVPVAYRQLYRGGEGRADERDDEEVYDRRD